MLPLCNPRTCFLPVLPSRNETVAFSKLKIRMNLPAEVRLLLFTALQNDLLHNLMLHHQRACFLPSGDFYKSFRARILRCVLLTEQLPHLPSLSVNYTRDNLPSAVLFQQQDFVGVVFFHKTLPCYTPAVDRGA